MRPCPQVLTHLAGLQMACLLAVCSCAASVGQAACAQLRANLSRAGVLVRLWDERQFCNMDAIAEWLCVVAATLFLGFLDDADKSGPDSSLHGHCKDLVPGRLACLQTLIQ